jgi:hypothetical protein
MGVRCLCRSYQQRGIINSPRVQHHAAAPLDNAHGSAQGSAMTHFIKVTQVARNETLYVNIDTIRVLRPTGRAQETQIVFDQSHSVTVQDDPEVIAGRMRC